MSIINFSPYRQYLYSPISNIHKLKLSYKILFTILYLSITPFKYQFFIFFIYILFIAYYQLFKYFTLKSRYQNKFLKQLSIYIIIFILLVSSFKNVMINHYKLIKIYYPYLSILNFFLIIELRYCYIPIVMIKTLFFIYTTISLLNIIFYTSKLEDITLLFLYIVTYITTFNNLFKIFFLFSCSIATQFSYIIMNEFQNNIISIKIRKTNQSNIKYIIYFYNCLFFINEIISNIENATYTLYNREIIDKHFYLIRI